MGTAEAAMSMYKPAATENSLSGKVLIVTGSTQGLGEAFARRAAYLDAAGIVVCGRNQDKGPQVAKQIEMIGCPCHYVAADLSLEEDCRRIVRQCDERFGRVDGLVNSAGLTSRGTLDDTSVALWDQLYAVNVRAPFILMREVARLMRREGSQGSIVNIITMGSYGGPPELIGVLLVKGRAGHPDKERRLSTAAGSHSSQRHQYRLDRNRGGAHGAKGNRPT
jgi:NAD(P)-dependent dehydrogenase (short-subunit alcohol dehydrogenase family)